MKRFWKTVTTEETGDGWKVLLDGRPVSTPARRTCVVPVPAIAAAIAEEWAAQDEDINPLGMPMTRTAATCLDRVAPHLTEVRDTIAAYGESDLICYRADRPGGLVARQRSAWNPMLSWASTQLAANLRTAVGVMHVEQPPEAVERLRAALGGLDAWKMTAMADLVQISGSLVLSLAILHSRLDAAEAWALSRIDEQWNIDEWGEDADAAALAGRRESDFTHAANVLRLLGTDS